MLINLANLTVESPGNESYTHWVIIRADFQQADDKMLRLTLSESKQSNQCKYLWCKHPGLIFNNEPNVSELMQLLKEHRSFYLFTDVSLYPLCWSAVKIQTETLRKVFFLCHKCSFKHMQRWSPTRLMFQLKHNRINECMRTDGDLPGLPPWTKEFNTQPQWHQPCSVSLCSSKLCTCCRNFTLHKSPRDCTEYLRGEIRRWNKRRWRRNLYPAVSRGENNLNESSTTTEILPLLTCVSTAHEPIHWV